MVTFANLGSVRLQSLEDTAHLVSDVVGPVTLTFDLLTLKRVHGYGPMGFHGAKYGLPGPFRSRLRSRHVTDRLTDKRRPSTFKAPSLRRSGHNK